MTMATKQSKKKLNDDQVSLGVTSETFVELEAKISAIDKVQATIEFDMDGIILNANENFLNALGYSLEEIQGKHHSLFVEDSYKDSREYKEFWEKLKRGEYESGEYKRIGKGGKEVWIQSSYTPIFDLNGQPFKVVKYATDVTDQKLKNSDYSGQIAAISKSQAVIEFNMDGIVLNANEIFLNALGYSLQEIKGKHHSLFVEDSYKNSREYKEFWEKLNRGDYEAGEYKRIGKGGKEVWIQSSYNPIFDLNGKPFKVVKYATEITDQKLKNSDYSGQIAAIGKAQAVIEFNMDGIILNANENFLNALGYSLKEVKGKHHSFFVEDAYKNSREYQEFWEKLKRGDYEAGEYKRIGKGGKEVWIQSSYNPIFDLNGKPFKVVKYATDVTDQKLKSSDYSGQIAAISKSLAVIEFDMDGIVLNANENFLDTVGYSLDEIRGQHHSLFVEDSYKNSREYQEFWKKLNRGVFESGEFKRIGKGDKEVWIQASYNPIFDLNGKPFKVVKYALDITEKTLELRNNKEKMDKVNSDLDLQNRLSSAVEALSNSVRGELNSFDLGENVLKKLSELLDIQVGIFYIMKDDKLELISSYAYTKRKHLSNSFAVGEGLVGQCAKEKKSIIITSVPDDYIKVSSGLGEGTPGSIMVTPIQFEGQLLGVLEIGKIGQFSDEDRRVLEDASDNIGIAVNSSVARVRMQKLLQETQAQEEELRVTNEEMQTQQEEMSAQQETLQDANKELEKKTVELKKSQNEIQEKNLSLEKQKIELIKQRELTEAKNVEVEKARKNVEEKAKELEISSKYKSEFLANMSHELRTPLNSLLILSESLSDNDENNLTDDQVEAAKIIHSGGKDLLNLINDILDLSKVEAGKLDVLIEDVSVNSVFTNLQRQFSPIAKHKGIGFNIDNQYQRDVNISTDKTRLEQILKNFLSNAFKFTETGSVTLQLHKPAEDVEFQKSHLTPSNCVGIKVIDTGIGIPKDKQLLIFEAFQQADGSVSRKHGGTGLGLSISRELAKLLECEIKLESMEGKGSAFTLYIPIKSNIRDVDLKPTHPLVEKDKTSIVNYSNNIIAPTNYIALPTTAESTNISSDKKCLLIIEDDEKFKDILLNIARKRGYDGVSTKSGKEGIELARSLNPTAISLDIGLPDIDGLEVLQALKSDPLTNPIPVHVLSGSDDLLQFYQYGAIGVSKKPMDQKKLSNIFDKIDAIHSGKIRQVLVVEDDANSQVVIAKLIHHHTIELTQVTSGQEAVRLLQGDISYDALILDLGLPDMTGLNLLKKLKGLKSIEIPPVIVYTAKEIDKKEYSELSKFAPSFILKGANSANRLLDDLSLFLHLNLRKRSRSDPTIAKVPTKNFREVFQGKHVLLVDDDLRNTFALSGTLKKHGLDVIMADNGKMSIEKLEENSDIQLVIMDIMMPIMDGYEAMSRIRQQKRFDHIPIIALTAKVLPEDRRKAFECGADDFLTKPVDIGKLLEIASKWLSIDTTQKQKKSNTA